MSKYMTLSQTTFKKVDLKRIEQYTNSNDLYIIVAGRKDPILLKCNSDTIANNTRKRILKEIEE